MYKNRNSFEIIFDTKSENESYARVDVQAICTRIFKKQYFPLI